MTVDELITNIKKHNVKEIDFEDYFGNTIFTLKDVDIADIEPIMNTEEGLLRLQKINDN